MKQYTATANDEGVRLSRFVQSVTRDFPTSLLYKSFRNKRIKVNGKKGVPEDRIKAGDLIELYINDEFFPPEGAKPTRKPAPKKQQNQPKVTVIYEDENIAVLYKPIHLLCHSDRTGRAGGWACRGRQCSASALTAALRASSSRPRATPPSGT